MGDTAYLDYNAGAPARPEVVAAMAEALGDGGNPSSVHAHGRRARKRMQDARAAVAALAGADPAGVVFTSGGTEANALVLSGCGRARVLVSAIEHPSVRDAVRDAEIVPVGADGRVDLAALDRRLAADDGPALVSVMAANNETGILQPVSEVARLARARGALVHCDAAQAAGRVPLSMSDLGVDFLTLSAHKLGGPAGIGAVLLADPAFELAPMLHGGGQERHRRAGTENLAGIVGFGIAARIGKDDLSQGDAILVSRDLRDRLEAGARSRVPGARVIGAESPRLPNTSMLALPGVPGQVQVMALDLAGIMVSAGAACSSGKVAASAVLAAMGLAADVAACAIRVSLGWGSAPADVERFLGAWTALAERKGFDVYGAAEAA
ncbi:MAG: cysteine desulfurase family protein [Magnetospirillum sp.]|nr:cysteine desulfurase family protein [Magnetospirillum sp.]